MSEVGEAEERRQPSDGGSGEGELGGDGPERGEREERRGGGEGGGGGGARGGASDACFNCGQTGHKARGCPSAPVPRAGERRPARGEEDGTSVLVKNLHSVTTCSTLRVAFEKYGEIKDVYIPCHHVTKQPKNFAFIEFSKLRDAEDAIAALDHTKIDGMPVDVMMAKQKRKSANEMRGGPRSDRREDDRYHERHDARQDDRFARGGSYGGRGGYDYPPRGYVRFFSASSLLSCSCVGLSRLLSLITDPALASLALYAASVARSAQNDYPPPARGGYDRYAAPPARDYDRGYDRTSYDRGGYDSYAAAAAPPPRYDSYDDYDRRPPPRGAYDAPYDRAPYPPAEGAPRYRSRSRSPQRGPVRAGSIEDRLPYRDP
jgi:hypothetical protein